MKRILSLLLVTMIFSMCFSVPSEIIKADGNAESTVLLVQKSGVVRLQKS